MEVAGISCHRNFAKESQVKKQICRINRNGSLFVKGREKESEQEFNGPDAIRTHDRPVMSRAL